MVKQIIRTMVIILFLIMNAALNPFPKLAQDFTFDSNLLRV